MKKRLSILAVLVLAITVTAYSVSGTYAKYTSDFTGATSTARVAKWAFEINDTAVSTTFDFDLFESVNDSNVKTGTNENIIAPGTTGSFAIKLANKSEVNANYTVDYTVTNTANIPVEFSIDGTNWTTSLADVTTPVAINKGGTAPITIYWRWAFTGDASANYTATQNDGTDTTLGLAGSAVITVNAAVTVTQVD